MLYMYMWCTSLCPLPYTVSLVGGMIVRNRMCCVSLNGHRCMFSLCMFSVCRRHHSEHPRDGPLVFERRWEHAMTRAHPKGREDARARVASVVILHRLEDVEQVKIYPPGVV